MKIAILTNQQFWNAPLGSASTLRSRYRIFKKKYDVDVIFLRYPGVAYVAQRD